MKAWLASAGFESAFLDKDKTTGIPPGADPNALLALAEALQALPAKLNEARASQALDPLLKRIGQTTDPNTLQALTPAQLNEAQASQALDPVLKQIGLTTCTLTPPFTPLGSELAQALQALAAKLSEGQASQALDLVLKQIGQTTDPYALRWLAEALQALSAKLNEAQVVQASNAAASSLGWAATNDEAAEWARALVALAHPAFNRDRMLAAAIAYPTAAGSSTEVLLDAVRAEHLDAPAKEKGTEAALEWLAKTYPDVFRPPVCPPPLQAGLKCLSRPRLDQVMRSPPSARRDGLSIVHRAPRQIDVDEEKPAAILFDAHGEFLTGEAIRWCARYAIPLILSNGPGRAILFYESALEADRAGEGVKGKHAARIRDVGPSLVRAQALADPVPVARAIVSAKLKASAKRVPAINERRWSLRLDEARSVAEIVTVEARIAAAYWRAFRDQGLRECKGGDPKQAFAARRLNVSCRREADILDQAV
jgi:hypothetical protein